MSYKSYSLWAVTSVRRGNIMNQEATTAYHEKTDTQKPDETTNEPPTPNKNGKKESTHTKIIPITTSDIIYLIENDVLKNKLRNKMFMVDGRPYLMLPHCEGVYEKDPAGIPYYVEMDIDNSTNQLYNLTEKGNEKLRAELQRLCRIKHGMTAQNARLNEAIMGLQGDANQNKKIAVNRIQHLNDALYYDMMLEKNNKIIKITKDGWKLIDDNSMMNPDNDKYVFMRYSHQIPQVMPSSTPDFKLLDKYCEMENDEMTFLMKTDINLSFLPHVQHPITQIQGPAGTGKTRLAQTISSLVDPTFLQRGNTLSKKTKPDDLIRILYQGRFIVFDNVSSLTKEENDILAQVVTGLSRNNRALYTDDDAFLYPNFTRGILLNGITITGTEPDVLDRTNMYEAKEPKNKIDENILNAQFEQDKPHILSAILDNVSQALGYVDEMDIEIPDSIRLRDYARYGCAIAKVMGHEPEEFLSIYISTFEDRNEMALASNPLGAVLLEYMGNVGYFMGSPDDLLAALQVFIEERDISVSYGFPHDAKSIGTELLRIEKNLKAVGIDYIKGEKKVNNRRHYVITNKNFEIDPSRKPISSNSSGIKVSI